MPHFHIDDLHPDSVGKASTANLQATLEGEKGRADHSFTSTEAHTYPFNAQINAGTPFF